MIVPGVIQTGELNDLFRGMLSASNFERERMLHCLTPGHQHADTACELCRTSRADRKSIYLRHGKGQAA